VWVPYLRIGFEIVAGRSHTTRLSHLKIQSGIDLSVDHGCLALHRHPRESDGSRLASARNLIHSRPKCFRGSEESGGGQVGTC
jgi:hypothetical protein